MANQFFNVEFLEEARRFLKLLDKKGGRQDYGEHQKIPVLYRSGTF